MLKRLVAVVTLLVLAVLVYLWRWEDTPPQHLPAALRLAVGISAKLYCSGTYVSGFDRETNLSDLRSYSPVTDLVHLEDTGTGVVRAQLLGVTAVARHRPGLGCTLTSDREAFGDVSAEVVSVASDEEWPRGSRVDSIDPGVQSLLDDLLQVDNRAGLATRALLVVQDGRVLAEAYAPGISVETPLLGWSMAKSVTAMSLGRLEFLGGADVADTALFPAWSADTRAAITLEQLLQMTTGLDFAEDYVAGGDATRMLFSSYSASDVAMASPLAHEPGTYFSYSSGTTNLLARLLFERLGGDMQAQIDFFRREFVGPLGLRRSIFEQDASGVFVGSSYLYAPARDWARLGQLMVAGGEINGHRILSTNWVQRAVAPNGSANYRRYGYQFWLNRGDEFPEWPALPADAYAMKGNRKQLVMMVPSRRAVIVRLGWSSGDYPVDANFARILAALAP